MEQHDNERESRIERMVKSERDDQIRQMTKTDIILAIVFIAISVIVIVAGFFL